MFVFVGTYAVMDVDICRNRFMGRSAKRRGLSAQSFFAHLEIGWISVPRRLSVKEGQDSLHVGPQNDRIGSK